MKKIKVYLAAACAISMASAPFFVTAASAQVSGHRDTVSANGREVIQFWNFWGSPQHQPIIQHIVNAFNASQNKIFVQNDYLPWGAIWTKELATVAAGNPPDVVIQDINSVKFRAQAKQATNLTPFLKKDNILKKFFPQLVSAASYNGNVYGIPYNTDTRYMYYNKTLFKAAGLNPNNPPQTWAQLDHDAWVITNHFKKDGQYSVIGFYPLWGGFGATNWMINADGGRNFIQNKGHQVLVNTPGKLAALQWIDSYTRKLGLSTVETFQSQFGSNQQDPFLSGKVAIYPNLPNFYQNIAAYAPKLNFGIAPMPSRTATSGHWSWGGGFDAEIPYGSKHAAAAWQFIKFLTNAQSQAYWAENVYDTVGNRQAIEIAAHDKKLTPQAQMVWKATLANLKWTVLTPQELWAPNYMNIINNQINAATNLEFPPQKALTFAQQQVERLVQQTSHNG